MSTLNCAIVQQHVNIINLYMKDGPQQEKSTLFGKLHFDSFE